MLGDTFSRQTLGNVTMGICSLIVVGSTLCVASSDDYAASKSLRAVLMEEGEILFDSKASMNAIEKDVWINRKGSRWTKVRGMMKGIASTEEYRASNTEHPGGAAYIRLDPKVSGKHYIIRFSFKGESGNEGGSTGYFEFGHGQCRVLYGEDGIRINAKKTLIASSDIPIKKGVWYDVLAEIVSGEVSIQFSGGPTLRASNPTIGKKTAFQIKGLGEGTLWLKDIKVRSPKATANKTGSRQRSPLPRHQG